MVYASFLGPLVGFLKGGSALKVVGVSAAFLGTGASHDAYDAFDDGDFIGHGDPNSLEDHGSHGGHDHGDHGDHTEHGDHEDHAEHEDHEHGDHEEHEHGEEHEENAEDHTEDPEEHGVEGDEHENLEDEAAHEAGAEEMEVAHGLARPGQTGLENQKTENEGLGAAFSRVMKGVAATSVMVSAASRLVEARSREFGLSPWGDMAAACISPPPKMKKPRVRARRDREEASGLSAEERASRAL